MLDTGLLPCANCGGLMRMGYVCGEYFVFPSGNGCEWCNGFTEMHATLEQEREVWNKAVERGGYIVREAGADG